MRASYREYAILNKNIIISFVAALTVSAITAHLLAGHERYLNSSYTAAVDFAVFYSSFAALFYLDNRRKYRMQDGRMDRSKLKGDLLRIITSLGAGELVYVAARWYSQYHLLTIQYEPYLASIIAHLVSTLVYLIVVNLGVRLTRLYRHDA